MDKPSYSVTSNDNLIYARLMGHWCGTVDLAYLTDLTIEMDRVRSGPWAIFIDMRYCDFTVEIYETDIRFKQALDRRNQIAECWLVKDEAQGEFLRHFVESVNIPLGRFTDEKQAIEWLKGFGFNLIK